jgi:hypothetical protein
VQTLPANQVSSSYANLSAFVNPNGPADALYGFQWGTTTGYGNAACCFIVGSGTADINVSLGINSGLTPNTTYNFRAFAYDGCGTNYGSNVVYEGDTVYVDGTSVGTQEQYAQQAVVLADTGTKAEATKEEEWLPLGVFAMIQGERTDSNDLFQLAVNKAGTIRGNYYNALTDATLPVHGAVDKSSQRAAWTVGDRKEPIYEAGFANLTKSETTLLVHFGKDRSQQWTLIRIDPPEEKK